MRHEVVAARHIPLPAEVFRHNVYPLRRVKRGFDKALFGNISAFQKLAEFVGIIAAVRDANCKKTGKSGLLSVRIMPIICAAFKLFLSKCRQYRNKVFNTVNAVHGTYVLRIFRLSVASFQFDRQHFVYYRVIYVGNELQKSLVRFRFDIAEHFAAPPVITLTGSIVLVLFAYCGYCRCDE